MTEAAAASAEEQPAPSRPSAWTRFWDRFFPREEHSDFLWIVLPVILITWFSGPSAQTAPAYLAQFFPTGRPLQALSRVAFSFTGWRFVLVTLFFYALPWLLGVWLFQRLGRSPNAIGLYALLVTLIMGLSRTVPVTARWILGPALGAADPTWFAFEIRAPLVWAAAPPLAVLAGAFLASATRKRPGYAVSLQDAEGTETSGLGWLGWMGWTPVGRERFVLCFAAVNAAGAALFALASLGFEFDRRSVAAGAARHMTWSRFALQTAPYVLTFAALVATAFVVVKRWHGPRSVWIPRGIGLGSSAALAAALPFNARTYMSIQPTPGQFDRLDFAAFLLVPTLSLTTALAPLLGVWLATRAEHDARPATGQPEGDA